jgi:hypothetical protein
MIADVISRISSLVPELTGRIEGAANFTELMRSNALPQVTPAAHVLPLGLIGAQGEAGAGYYTQNFEQVIGVLITLRTLGATGAGGLVQIDQLVMDIINAVAGWGPETAVGVFRLVRGQLVSMSAGTMVYQIDFSILDQLRITP